MLYKTGKKINQIISLLQANYIILLIIILKLYNSRPTVNSGLVLTAQAAGNMNETVKQELPKGEITTFFVFYTRMLPTSNITKNTLAP